MLDPRYGYFVEAESTKEFKQKLNLLINDPFRFSYF